MDGRVETGFRHRLEAVLSTLVPEERHREVERLLGEARGQAARGEMPLVQALLRAYERTRDAVRGGQPGVVDCDVPRFLCDPSLAGLARWLHAAGYEASLAPDVPGHRLPEEALGRGLVLLTTDAEVLERRIVVSGALRVVWLPSSLTTREKLGLVLRELGLGLREPRCMACGGPLVARAKDSVFGRIPPRTARWKDEYFVCAACDRLYWRGTHWDRISPALRAAVPA